MKKKMTISVADLLNKNHCDHPNSGVPPLKVTMKGNSGLVATKGNSGIVTTKGNSGLVTTKGNSGLSSKSDPHRCQDGPISFEEMYQQMMKKTSEGQETPKYIF